MSFKYNLDQFQLQLYDDPFLGSENWCLSWTDKSGDLVAVIAVEKEIMPDGYRWFGNFAVMKESYRRRGIGTQILQYVMKQYKVGAMIVVKDNIPALNLYKKLGFEIIDDSDSEVYVCKYKPNFIKNAVTQNSSGKRSMWS